MRIPGASIPAGGPIAGGVGATPMVDSLMQMEAVPLNSAKQRRDRIVSEKNEYNSLGSLLGELGKAAGQLKHSTGFNQLKVDSSHPDILDGSVAGLAMPGQYEFEVKGLAQADKFLAAGFSSLQDHAGFGYMQIESPDGQAIDLTIDPGATLSDVRDRINEAGAGVKAQVINTGASDNPLRLLVTSETTGAAAKINLDPDTTFFDFDKLKAAKNLDVMFEDVAIQRGDNKLGDVLEGINLNAKRAQPGTKVQVNVSHDVDKTLASIKGFTDTYNKISNFISTQNAIGAEGRATGTLAGDGNLRGIMRQLQAQVASGASNGNKFGSLTDIGITTNAKSGELVLDETKLKSALGSNYEDVAKLFVQSESGAGVAARLADAVKQIDDPVHGVLKNRSKSLERMIHDQDQVIGRQVERLATKREQVERQFATLDSKMASLQGQSQFLAARFGGAAQPASNNTSSAASAPSTYGAT